MLKKSLFGLAKALPKQKPFSFKFSQISQPKQKLPPASIPMQQQWQSFSPSKKIALRLILPNQEWQKERKGLYPNKYDCSPMNPNRDSQIYLSGKKGNKYAYTKTNDPTKIYFENVQTEDPERIGDIIEHEEVHNILTKEHAPSVSSGWDYMTMPAYRPPTSLKIVNPKTAGKPLAYQETRSEIIQKGFDPSEFDIKLKEIRGRVANRTADLRMSEGKPSTFEIDKEEPESQSNPYGFTPQEQKELELARQQSRLVKERQNTPQSGLGAFQRKDIEKRLRNIAQEQAKATIPEPTSYAETLGAGNIPIYKKKDKPEILPPKVRLDILEKDDLNKEAHNIVEEQEEYEKGDEEDASEE